MMAGIFVFLLALYFLPWWMSLIGFILWMISAASFGLFNRPERKGETMNDDRLDDLMEKEIEAKQVLDWLAHNAPTLTGYIIMLVVCASLAVGMRSQSIRANEAEAAVKAKYTTCDRLMNDPVVKRIIGAK